MELNQVPSTGRFAMYHKRGHNHSAVCVFRNRARVWRNEHREPRTNARRSAIAEQS